MTGELLFVIHGKIVSANHFKANVGGRMVKTKEAKEDARRVREIATVAATGWEIPQAVAVFIDAYNSRLDADNVSKVILDAVKGVAMRDDADMMSLAVFRRWDREGERYAVSIRAVADERPGSSNGARKPRRITDGLPDSGLVTFAQLDAMKREGLV